MNLNPRIAIAVLAAAGISYMGVETIVHHEGERLIAYIPVPGDVPTIGAGATTYEDGSPVKLGDTITLERSKQLVKHHAKRSEKAVTNCVKVPLYQYEFDAYVSLTYNIGPGAFCKSTLVKLVNEYKYTEACDQILRWDKFKGQTLKGLTNRRIVETLQCLGNQDSRRDYALVK